MIIVIDETLFLPHKPTLLPSSIDTPDFNLIESFATLVLLFGYTRVRECMCVCVSMCIRLFISLNAWIWPLS
jgi:hypothetical protein